MKVKQLFSISVFILLTAVSLDAALADESRQQVKISKEGHPLKATLSRARNNPLVKRVFLRFPLSATISSPHLEFSLFTVSALLHQSPIRIRDAESALTGSSSRFAIQRTRKPSVPYDVQKVLLKSRGY